MRLATHNSGTGEKPANFFARFFPFVAKCQDKTLAEQCEAGVELFDLRVRWYKGDCLIHHGLARYDTTLDEALDIIDRKAKPLSVVMVTYEGSLNDYDTIAFKNFVNDRTSHYLNLRLGSIAVKKPVWDTLDVTKFQPNYIQNYPKLVGWKALFPFPCIWHMWHKDIETESIVMLDFV